MYAVNMWLCGCRKQKGRQNQINCKKIVYSVRLLSVEEHGCRQQIFNWNKKRLENNSTFSDCSLNPDAASSLEHAINRHAYTQEIAKTLFPFSDFNVFDFVANFHRPQISFNYFKVRK